MRILDGLLMTRPVGASASSTLTPAGSPTTSSPRALRYAFVPRIRDLPSKRLYVFERAGVPKRLRPLVGGKGRRALIGLNKGEAHHALKRAINGFRVSRTLD